MSVKPIQDKQGGMVSFDPIAAERGTTVRTYESSAADSAKVYVHLTEQPSFDDPSGREVAALLDMDAVQALRDQCDWYLKNHYLVKG